MKMKIESYSVDAPISGICKQYGVWAQEGNAVAPLIYFQRPKWIKDDAAWKKLVESVRLGLPQGFEVK